MIVMRKINNPKKFFRSKNRTIVEKCLVKIFPYRDQLIMILWVLLMRLAKVKLKRPINPWL